MVKLGVHPETGALITPSENNPKYGSVRVDSVAFSMKNGFVNKVTRSAFLRGEIEILKEIYKKEGQTLPGCIVRLTSHNPFYEGQPNVVNPTTGEIALLNEKPYFQQFEYSETDKVDEYVEAPVWRTAAKATATAETV